MADANATQSTTSGSSISDDLDFHRGPGYQDYMAHMGDARAAFESTPQEAHQDAHDEMRAVMANLGLPSDKEGASTVYGSVESKEARDEMAKLAAQNPDMSFDETRRVGHAMAEQSVTEQITEAKAQVAALEEPGASSSSSSSQPASAADIQALATRVTDLERTLSSIRLSAGRDERFVITGSDEVKVAFYNRLSEEGRIQMVGGQVCMDISKARAFEYLKEIAQAKGMEFHHATSLKFERYVPTNPLDAMRYGLGNTIRDGIGKAFRQDNQIDVLVIGDRATVDSRLKDLGDTLQKLDKAGLIPDDKKPPLDADGKLVLKDGEPYSIKADGKLSDLVTAVQTSVSAERAELDAKEAARKEFRNKDIDEKIAKANQTESDNALSGRASASADGASAAKGAATEAASTSAAKTYPNDEATGKLGKFHADLKSDSFDVFNKLPDEANKKATPNSVLGRVTMLKGDDYEKLGKASAHDRSELATHAAVLLAKGDLGKLGKGLTSEKLSEPNDKGVSTREKVGELVSSMAERDPRFEMRAAQHLERMEHSKTITPEQAAKAFETLAPGKDLAAVKEAAAKEFGPAVEDAKKVEVKASEAKESSTPQAAREEVRPEAAAASQDAARTVEPKVEAAANRGEALGPADGAKSAAPADKAQEPQSTAAESKQASLGGSAVEGAQASDKTVAKDAQAAATPAEKSSPLVEKLEAVAKAGPEALSREDASALLASLDGRRTSPLASLDGRGGNLPTETLTRIEGVLNEVAKGKHGDDLKASAQDLQSVVAKWKEQDATRLADKFGLTPDALDALRGSLQAKEGAWNGDSTTKVEAAVQKLVSNPAGVEKAAGPGEAAVGQASAAAAAERYSQTESAAGKLAALMNNPAGSFTNRDKSWNEVNINAAVNAVMRVDVAATKDMTQNQRNQLAAYAAWMADNANSGRLPGFDGAEGRARAEALTARASSLVQGASGQMPPAVTSQLGKADRMVAAMGQRSRGVARGTGASAAAVAATSRATGRSASQATPQGTSRSASNAAPHKSAESQAGPAVDGARLARDLGHAVFKEGAMSEPFAKYVMRNASSITAESMQALPKAERAQAAVALAHISNEVRSGALGDFKDLHPSMQRQVVSAQQTASALMTKLSQDPELKTALIAAHLDLQGGGSGGNSGKSQEAPKATQGEMPGKQSEGAQQQAPKNPERALDR